MTAKLRAAIGRAARRLVSEEVLVFLRGPRPNPAAASASQAAAQPAEEVATLMPARRLISEEVLIFLRGPRPNPAAAAAAAQPAGETELFMKSDAFHKRGSTSRYPRRPTHVRKKTGESGLEAVPWFLGTLLTLTFLEGYELGKGNDQKLQEG